MGILADVIQMKKMEEERELRDIAQIGTAVNTFLSARKQRIEIEDIKSKIAERERTSGLDDFITLGKVGEAAKSLNRPDIFQKAQQASGGFFNTQQPQVQGGLIDESGSLSLDQNPNIGQNGSVEINTPDSAQADDFRGNIGQTDVFGEETQQSKLGTKQVEADIGVDKSVDTQREKAREKTVRDTIRAAIVSQTAQDEVLRFDQENFEKFGVKPGDYFGLFAKLQPKQTNEYKAAAVGAGREAAATVGMSIIPAARAVRMVDIFAQSSAEIGNTQEGNANNVAASMANTFARQLADNIDMELEGGGTAKMQDLIVDPKTGKKLSELPLVNPDGSPGERFEAIDRVRSNFRDKTRDFYIMKTFRVNPDLLKEETVQEILDNMSEEEVEALLSEED